MLAPFYYAVPEDIRYGKIYSAEKAELRRIGRLGAEELESEKDEALRKLIHYAYEHVPYYHNLFDENGISPDDISSEADLPKIPFLTKELVNAHRDELISDEFDKSQLVYLTTSGSTGTPTGFFVQKESPMREWVYCMNMLAPFGKKPDDSKLVMRGKAFKAQEKGKLWQWDAFKRELSINIFEMTPDNMEQYCRAIEKYKPEFAYGYPSAMYTLCKYISTRQGGLRHQFRGFEAISEGYLPEQREFIEKTINARMFSFYGMSERVVIATNTPDFDGYEIQKLYGIAEIADEAGNIITQPNVTGEIVGTGLLNYAMPLIRYKTGDLSSWADSDSLYGEDNAAAGGKRRINPIAGRCGHDVLIGADGESAMTSLNVHTAALDKVLRYQLQQDEPGTVRIVIAANDDFADSDAEEIVREFSRHCSSNITFCVDTQGTVITNKNGKTPLVVQNINT